MRTWTRTAVIAVGVAAASAAIGPAVAGAPAGKPTALTLKAAHATVAPKHKTAVTATLRSYGKPVADETVYLEARAAGTRAFGNPVAIGSTDAKGQVALAVTPGNKKGHKEQYEVTFPGDTGYRRSHSAVITITVS